MFGGCSTFRNNELPRFSPDQSNLKESLREQISSVINIIPQKPLNTKIKVAIPFLTFPQARSPLEPPQQSATDQNDLEDAYFLKEREGLYVFPQRMHLSILH